MKRKRSSLKIAKDKAWKLCSTVIRMEAADQNGYAKCFTCGKVAPWQELQAGHFIAGRYNSILFDERGIRPQCRRCNIFGSGEPVLYMIALEKELGEHEAVILRDELIRQKNKSVTISLDEYEQKITDYKLRIEKNGG